MAHANGSARNHILVPLKLWLLQLAIGPGFGSWWDCSVNLFNLSPRFVRDIAKLTYFAMAETDLFGLKDAHVIITGASGGIGLASTDFFLNKLGSRISAHANKNSDPLKKFEIANSNLTTITANATSEEEVESFYRTAVQRFGPPEVLVGT